MQQWTTVHNLIKSSKIFCKNKSKCKYYKNKNNTTEQ